MISKTSTETLLSKKPKNPKNKTWYVEENIFNKNDISKIVENVLKCSSQWYCFRDR